MLSQSVQQAPFMVLEARLSDQPGFIFGFFCEGNFMKAVLCVSHDEFSEAGHGAIFLWNYGKNDKPGYIMLKCPGCGESSAMMVYGLGEQHPPNVEAWQIAGIPDNIGLTPSINCVGCCGWHDYLENGEYRKC